MAVLVNRLSIPIHPVTRCAFCGQHLGQESGHLYAWHSTSGKLYCSEFCADDEEDTASRMPPRIDSARKSKS